MFFALSKLVIKPRNMSKSGIHFGQEDHASNTLIEE